MAVMSTIKLLALILALIALALVALAFRTVTGLGQDGAQAAMALATAAPTPTATRTPTALAPLPFPPTPLPVMTPPSLPMGAPTVPMTPTYIVLSEAPSPSPTVKTGRRATTPRRAAARSAGKEPEATPTTPARTLDPHLPPQVSIQEAPAAVGQSYWRLVSVRWLPPAEATGRHHIYIEVVDEQGHRLGGQAVRVSWPGGSVVTRTDTNKPQGEAVSFPQYGLLGSYSVTVEGLPSDEIRGLGLGLPGNGVWADHTCWYLLFQRSRKTQ